MGATNPNVVNKEVVAAGLPILWDLDNSTTYDKLIDAKAKKWDIKPTPNSDDFRAPMKMKGGGIYGTVNLAGGPFGQTSGPTFEQMTQTAFTQKVGFDLNASDFYYHDNPSLSTVNIGKDTIDSALKIAKRYANAAFFSDGFGSGSRGLVAHATGESSGTYTFETEFGANLLVDGMAVDIFDNSLASYKTAAYQSNLPIITAINTDTNQAVLTNYSGITLSSTDYLAFPGVGANPAWTHGLYYFNNVSTSGSVLGVSKTTYPTLVPTNFNANGAAPTVAMGYKLEVGIRQKRGIVKKLTGVMHPVTAAQFSLAATTIAEFQRGASLPTFDVAANTNLTSTQPTLQQWGKTHWIDALASRKRIDWWDMENFGKVVTVPIGFYKNPKDGTWFWDKRDGDGSLVAGWQFYLLWKEDYINRDPGAGGVIYGLSGTLGS
jgi:hypothetical protein